MPPGSRNVGFGEAIGRGLTTAILLGALCLGAATCTGGGNPDDQAAGDTLTQRQKDSILSTLPVPGAEVVGKALDAAEAARARAELHDTIG